MKSRTQMASATAAMPLEAHFRRSIINLLHRSARVKSPAATSYHGRCRCSLAFFAATLALGYRPPAARHHPEEGDQNDRADNRDDEASQVQPGHVESEEHSAQPAAQDRAQDTNNDVADQAEATRSHDHTGEKARDEPQYKPSKY